MWSVLTKALSGPAGLLCYKLPLSHGLGDLNLCRTLPWPMHNSMPITSTKLLRSTEAPLRVTRISAWSNNAAPSYSDRVSAG